MFSRFRLYQYKFWRKLFRGYYYYINPKGLPMNSFWSNMKITSCQSVIEKVEYYD